MNSVQMAIYREGVNIKTEYFFTSDGDEIKDEYILYYHTIYCYTFYNGELVNFRRDN